MVVQLLEWLQPIEDKNLAESPNTAANYVPILAKPTVPQENLNGKDNFSQALANIFAYLCRFYFNNKVPFLT
jgi:hypothetical protein